TDHRRRRPPRERAGRSRGVRPGRTVTDAGGDRTAAHPTRPRNHGGQSRRGGEASWCGARDAEPKAQAVGPEPDTTEIGMTRVLLERDRKPKLRVMTNDGVHFLRRYSLVPIKPGAVSVSELLM